MYLNTTGIYIALIIGISIFSSCKNEEKQKKKKLRQPNIVLIMSDDQGWGDLSIHGNKNIRTPNIDRLAKQGVQLDRFYASPLCSPTRGGLLTGRYHLRAGVLGVRGGQELLDLNEVTIADVFKEAGYATGCFGKWHNGLQYPYHPNGRGFDEFFGFCSGVWLNYFDTNLEHNGKKVKTKGFIIDVLTDKAMNFIEKNNSNVTGKPFFCYIPYNTPHAPLQVPDKFYDQVKARGISMYARPEEHEDLNTTIAALAMCENIDMNVGRILQKLKNLNLTDNTIVIYLSDNGPAAYRWNQDMRGKKGMVDEGGVRVPFFIRWPDHIPEGLVLKNNASYIDILPTLADLAGVSTKSCLPLDGISLKDFILGKDNGESNRILFSSIHHRYAVRQGSYLKIRNELYNLKEDPGQRTNIASKESKKFEYLSDTLRNWQQDVTSNIDSVRWYPVGYVQSPETRLEAQDAKLYKSAKGNLSYASPVANSSYLTNWDDTVSYVSWNIETHRQGNYEFSIEYTCPSSDIGGEFDIICGKRLLKGKITEAFNPEFLPSPDRVERHEAYEKEFRKKIVGVMKLEKEKYNLTIRAIVIPGKQLMDFKAIDLRYVD